MFGDRNPKRRTERQLRVIVQEITDARAQLVVVAEQWAAFQEDDEDARTRALVSDSYDDTRNAEHAHRHAELMRDAVAKAERRVIELEARRDQLLQSYQP